jgi:hypothetical protein
MLGSAIGELGEGGQEGFYSGPWHLAELPREDSFAPAGADGCCEDNLDRSQSVGLFQSKDIGTAPTIVDSRERLSCISDSKQHLD